MKKITKNDLVKNILKDFNDNVTDEEVIHLLLENKLSAKDEALFRKETFGQRAADNMAKFAGSWTFILIFMAILVCWMIINISFLTNPFDPFPFILLNLLLSCTAAVQAPLIMMSQNREEQKYRRRADNDYRVNLKTEIIIEDLHIKIDSLLKNQEAILRAIDKDISHNHQ